MTRHPLWLTLALVAGLVCLSSGCLDSGTDDNETDGDADQLGDGDTSDGDSEDGDAEQGEPSLAETLGLTQYVGQIDPIEYSRKGGVTTYTFDPDQGPLCMRGADYTTSVRDSDSDNLLIFLQGGGACWSEFCLAVTGAFEGIPDVEIMNPEFEGNPVADWDMVYLPYCDGSMFVGDAEYDDNIYDNGARYHHGLANLTGAFEVVAQQFPQPKRILLAGSSGGAYGLLLAGPLLRHYYPDTELIMMADSGIGIGRDGDDAYMQVLLDEFNVQRFIPEDCPLCLDNGHLTGLFAWFLERDANLRIGMYSSWYDGVLAGVFLQIPGSQYADALQAQTDRIHTAYPDRFRRFITDGKQHTSLLADPSGIIGSDLGAVELPEGALTDLMSNVVLGGLETTRIGEVTMAGWLAALIANDLDAWVDIQEERGPAPDEE